MQMTQTLFLDLQTPTSRASKSASPKSIHSWPGMQGSFWAAGKGIVLPHCSALPGTPSTTPTGTHTPSCPVASPTPRCHPLQPKASLPDAREPSTSSTWPSSSLQDDASCQYRGTSIPKGASKPNPFHKQLGCNHFYITAEGLAADPRDQFHQICPGHHFRLQKLMRVQKAPAFSFWKTSISCFCHFSKQRIHLMKLSWNHTQKEIQVTPDPDIKLSLLLHPLPVLTPLLLFCFTYKFTFLSSHSTTATNWHQLLLETR